MWVIKQNLFHKTYFVWGNIQINVGDVLRSE